MGKHWWLGACVISTLLLFCQAGCQKTDHPFGIYSPMGLDVPTYTPTPDTGAIQVYVQDSGLAVQGVTVLVVDPTGNTLAPRTTQPAVGFAAFNPSVLYSGVWRAEVATQGVTFVSNGATVRKYYYSSSLPLTIAGSGQYAVTFSAGGEAVSMAPVSQTFTTFNPETFVFNLAYNQPGNLNVPVTAALNPLNSSFSASATQFIFGQGVSTAAMTITKGACVPVLSQPLTLTSRDFVGTLLPNVAISSLVKGYPVSISVTQGDPGDGTWTLYLTSTNDCDIHWSVVETGDYTVSGTIVNGGSFNTPAYSANTHFVISSPFGTLSTDQWGYIRSTLGTKTF